MLVAKLCSTLTRITLMFENYVNYAGSKTWSDPDMLSHLFENYVNYAGSKT